MFKGLASLFYKLVGGQQTEKAKSESSQEVQKNKYPAEEYTESTTVIAQPAAQTKVRSSLPDLPPIDTLVDFVSDHTVTFSIPKNPSESFILRPIIPSDRSKMHSALNKGEISTTSLFMRFTTAKKTFTEKELDYFTRLNYSSHHGIGVVLQKPGYQGVGTARYFVDQDDPTVAEWAVTVIDQYHGQGIGLAELNGIKKLKAVVNPDNNVILNWLTKCNSYEKYEDQSVFHVIDLPIPDDFYRMKELGNQIKEALDGKGKMDNASLFATKLELKQFYDDLDAKDSDTEDFTVTCSSYDSDSRSRLFTSNNHRIHNKNYINKLVLTEMMDEISISSRSNSIDDFDFDL